MKEGLIALQFWNGDRQRALENALLLAENEPTHRANVDLLFSARFDSTHDAKVVTETARKFNTRTYTTKTRATGHPWGCWGLWFSTIEWVYHMKKAGKVPDYKWIFAFESDTAPVRKDWLDQLIAEWDRRNPDPKNPSIYVLGSETFHWAHHINGNMMLSADMKFLKWLVEGVTVSGVRPNGAWDLDLFPHFARWGVGYTSKIRNVCGKPSLSQEEFEWFANNDTAFVHGVKNDDLYNLSRRNLLGK